MLLPEVQQHHSLSALGASRWSTTTILHCKHSKGPRGWWATAVWPATHQMCRHQGCRLGTTGQKMCLTTVQAWLRWCSLLCCRPTRLCHADLPRLLRWAVNLSSLLK